MRSMQIETTTAPLDVALSYLSRGWPCFPCRAADEEAVDRITGQVKYDPETGEVEILKVKTPITDNGFKAATRFAHIIRRWWQDNPTAMIGVPTGERIGAWVLDIDPRHDGNETLAALEAEYEPLPTTLSATTASGGRHYYFRHVQGVRNRGNLGPGIDVRGDGGYVIAPGSVTMAGGRYEWDNDLKPVDAPQWLLDLVVRREMPQRDVQHGNAHTNSAYVNAAVDRELSELASEPMGNRNNRLNDAAFALGTFVGAGALPEAEARALLQDVARGWGRDWARCAKTIENGIAAGKRSPRDIPQPEQDNTRLIDISRMIENGLRKAKAKADSALTGQPTDPPRDTDNAPQSTAAADTPALVATPFAIKDPKTLPRREFTYGTHYIRKYVSVTVAPGGLGKTSNSIVEALSMVSGKDLVGTKPPGKLNVWVFNSEDPRDELERRIMAAYLHYRLKPEDVEGRLFLDTGREQELVIAKDDKKGVRIIEPIVEAITNQINRLKIDVMIVDPFVSTHAVNENDNGAIDKVAKLWSHIADRTNCAIDIVHHLRKVGDREATVEDSRGAVALLGAARSVRVLNQMSEEDATSAGLSKQNRFEYFSIYQGKSNLTKRAANAAWRRLESVGLGNGAGLSKPQDFAGVVTEWSWPGSEDIIAELTPDQIRLIKVRVDTSEYKEGHRAKNWVGNAISYVLGLDPEDDATRRKATAIYKAMAKEGMLVKSEEHDHVRREAAVFIRSDEFRAAA
jgi:hypothetical protein